MKSALFQKSWVIFLVYSLLTLLFTWPLIVQINQSLYGYEIVGYNYDPFGTMEKFLSIKNTFLDQKKLFFSPYTYPGTDYPGAILTGLFNEVAAFNILLLVSFPLSGLFAYLLAHHLTQNRLAAFFGGLLYAFSPYHWIHAYYHLGISQIQWFPLYLWCLFLFLERPNLKRTLGLGLSLCLLVFSNYYYAFFTLILTVVFFLFYGLYFAWPLKDKPLPTKGFWRLLGGMGAAGGILLLILFQNLTLIYRHLDKFSVSYQDLFRYGSRPWGFVLPPLDNPVLGWMGRDYIQTHREGGLVEHTLYLGLIPVFLSLLALWGWLRKKEGFFSARFNQAAPFFLILTGVALLCSRPPVMTFGGLEIFLPSYYLHHLFPMFRSYARFGLLVYLSLSVLAAAGLSFLLKKGKPLWVAGLAVILLFAEYTNVPPVKIRPILPTEAHRWLAEHSSGALLVDYSKTNLANIAPVKRLLKNTLLPKTEMEAYNLFQFSDPLKIFRTIKAIGGHYIIVPLSLEKPIRGSGLHPFRSFSDSLLFKAPPSGEPVVIKYTSGFYSQERLAGAYYRRMAEQGVILLINPSGQEIEADLHLELKSFQLPRKVTLEIGPVIQKVLRKNPQRNSLEEDFLLGNPLKRNLGVSHEGGYYKLEKITIKPGFTALKLAVSPLSKEIEDPLKDKNNHSLSIALKKVQLVDIKLKDKLD